MKATFLYSIIFIITISILQLHGMEATQQLILSQQRYYQALSKKEHPYKNQILPDNIFDKIIAYSSREVRKNLKEVCTQLAFLTSINRLNQFVIHDFIIGDKKEKTLFFKELIKTNNPDLITPIITYAKKEAQLELQNTISDAICITTDPEEEKLKKEQKEKDFIQNNYLNPLLQEALKQDNPMMINEFRQQNINTHMIDKHYYNKVCICLLIISCPIWMPIGIAFGCLR